MQEIQKITEDIYRTTLPYKDIFTTVYALKTPEGAILFDAGSYDEDAALYIKPFLEELGITEQQLKYVFISHNHTDHAGGLNGFLPLYPNVTVLTRSRKLQEQYPEYKSERTEDGQLILGTYQVVTIPGHTKDCAGLLDVRTKTLISGDCLQSYGIRGSGTWAANIIYPAEHVEAVEKVRKLDIERIVTAHDYDPHGYRADGREAVVKNLDACITPLRNMQKLILEFPELDDVALQEKYNYDPELPKVKHQVIGAMRTAMEEKRIALL